MPLTRHANARMICSIEAATTAAIQHNTTQHNRVWCGYSRNKTKSRRECARAPARVSLRGWDKPFRYLSAARSRCCRAQCHNKTQATRRFIIRGWRVCWCVWKIKTHTQRTEHEQKTHARMRNNIVASSCNA